MIPETVIQFNARKRPKLSQVKIGARLAAAPPIEYEADGSEKLLTSDEVAERLKLGRSGLNLQRRAGRIPFLRLGRWLIRYRWSEIVAALEAPRVPREKALAPAFQIFANNYATQPGLKFKVEGIVNGRRLRKYFRSENAAKEFAAKQNNARGLAPLGKPEKVRGYEAPWLVGPYNATATPWAKFRAYARIGGKWVNKFFGSAREALRFANERNNELALETARAQLMAERISAAPAVVRLQAEVEAIPAKSPLTPEELAKAISLTNMRKAAYKVRRCTYNRLYKFVVDGGVAGERNRKYFSTEAEAKSFAYLRTTELMNKGIEGMDFPTWLRVMAQHCHKRLKDVGATLEDATKHYLEYIRQRNASCTLQDLLPQLIKSKEAQGVTRNYISGLKSYLGKAIKALGPEKFTSEITTRDINLYLESLTVGLVSRNCIRMMLCTMFSFARQNAYCADNPAYTSTRAKEVEKPVGVYTPKEMGLFLENAPAEFVPFIAIGAFAGLRVSELGKLDWKEVNLEEGFIEVTAQKAKSARRRIVRILPNLDAWIRPYAELEGRVSPLPPQTLFSPSKYLGAAMRAAGITTWEKNALRHSFASYHLAHFKNIEALALEMGHRHTDLIFQHYRRVVTETSAKVYWQINPVPEAEAAKIAKFNRRHEESGVDFVERERQTPL